MVGNYITIHKQAPYKGPPIYGVIGTQTGRLCNPYDPDSATTQFNLEITCKSCLRILKPPMINDGKGEE